MLKRALQRRLELLAKIDGLFAKDSQGIVDYDGTEWSAAKDADYKQWMAELREQEAIIERCDQHIAAHDRAEAMAGREAQRNPATIAIDDMCALGTVAEAVRGSGLCAGRDDPMVSGMRGVAGQVLDIARSAVMGAQTTTDAEGGYSVPIIIAPELEIHYAADAPMVALATYADRESGNQFNIPTVDASGVTATRVAENTSPGAAVDLVFGQSAMGFDRFDTKIFTLTNELIQDSAVDIIAEFTAILFNTVLRALSDAATDGSGGNHMDGFTENANVTSALTSAAATAVAWGELAALFGSLSTRSQRNAVVQFNKTVEAYLFQQVDADKKPVILRDAAGGIAGTGGGLIVANGLNIPYAVNPKLPDIAASSKSVYVGDFARYRMFGAPNANGFAGVDVLIFTDSAYTSKNTVGMMARARRAGKYLSIASGHDCRFLTQKA